MAARAGNDKVVRGRNSEDDFHQIFTLLYDLTNTLVGPILSSISTRSKTQTQTHLVRFERGAWAGINRTTPILSIPPRWARFPGPNTRPGVRHPLPGFEDTHTTTLLDPAEPSAVLVGNVP